MENKDGKDGGEETQLNVRVVICAHPAHDWNEEDVDKLDDVAEEEEVRDLEKVEDDQRQSASLLQEEYVNNQPDGEEEEGETEDDKKKFFSFIKRADLILIRTPT